ncbi:hypothetical protein BH11PSE3_BH11PSE3_28960 [soil metagenome]
MFKQHAHPFVRTGFAVLMSSSLLFNIAAYAQSSAVQHVPGTTVSLTPPTGFVAASDFSGFKERDGAASIMVSELPAEAYPQISAVFGDLDAARNAFATKGITVNALKRLDGASGNVLLLSGTQTIGTQTFKKWMALIKGQKTVLITLQAPETSPLTDATAQKTIETVALGAPASAQEKIAELPFTLEVMPPFRIVDTIGGSTVLLTAGEHDVDPAGKQPMMVIAMAPSGAVPPGDLATTARALAAQTQGLKDASIDGEKAISFAGGDGILLSGKTGDGRRFSQYLAIGPQHRSIRLIAFVPADRVDDTGAAIEAVAKSIAFKR